MNRIAVALLILALPASGFRARAEQPSEKKKDESKPIVYTNADLPPAPPSEGSPPTPAPDSAPAEVPDLPAVTGPIPPSYDGHRDRDGHGEGWWRYRAALLDAAVLEAQILAERLHVQYVKGKTLSDSTLASRSREATLAWRALEAQRERLPEEMRQAGGLPGWLRRGELSFPEELLPAPVLDLPTREGGLGFSWKPVPGAAFYLIELQCDNCCGPVRACDPWLLDVKQPSARLPYSTDGTGRWRVSALDETGFSGDWSDWRSF